MSEECLVCLELFNLNEELKLKRPITHVFCDSCYQKMNDTSPKHEFINTISFPVIGFNTVGVIETANHHVCNLVDKEIDQILNKKGGDVIGCIHTELPNGCGGTPNCEHCVVRSSIIETHISGKSIIGKSAQQNVKSSTGPKKMDVKFSMERIKGLVLFQINSWILNE